jgi:hypothetical protein
LSRLPTRSAPARLQMIFITNPNSAAGRSAFPVAAALPSKLKSFVNKSFVHFEYAHHASSSPTPLHIQYCDLPWLLAHGASCEQNWPWTRKQQHRGLCTPARLQRFTTHVSQGSEPFRHRRIEIKNATHCLPFLTLAVHLA